MKQLTLTAEQTTIIASLTEDELEALVTDIRMLHHLTAIALALNCPLTAITINFDGKHDININLIKADT